MSPNIYADLISANTAANRSITNVEIPQSSQLTLPLWGLPIPVVIEMPFRESDKKIEHALAPLAPFPVTKIIYVAMLIEGRKTDLRPTHHYCLQIGYATIATIIRERSGVIVCKRSIQRAIERLIVFKYLQCTVPAHDGNIPATYLVLNCAAVMRMLSEARCEYFRLLRGRQIQFIRPI